MPIEIPEFNAERPVVLCLAGLHFVRDVKELQKRSTRYSWVYLQGLEMAQKPFVPKRLQAQSIYVNESGPDVDLAWQQAKILSLKVLADIRARGAKLVAVLAANWDYWWEEGMRMACAEVGLPFLVLMREHLLGDQLKLCQEYYGPLKRIPNPTAVACAGYQTRDILTALGLFPASKIRITGWPRMDIWRSPVPPAYDRPVLLMSYFKMYGADNHFIEMMHSFSRMSEQFPHIPFVVKAKNPPDRESLEQFSRKRGLKPQVVDTENLAILLCNARAVIGFSSATLYEALLAPTRILCPVWGETDQDPAIVTPSPADPIVRPHMEFLTSEDALWRAVAESAISNPITPDMALRRAAFAEYFAFAENETAVQRVEDFVAEFGLQ